LRAAWDEADQRQTTHEVLAARAADVVAAVAVIVGDGLLAHGAQHERLALLLHGTVGAQDALANAVATACQS